MNYVDKDVFVVGGANSAAQGALYLSRFAHKVTVLIRGPEATASKYLVDAMNANVKIEMLLNTDLVEVKGSNTLEQVIIKNTKRDEVQRCAAAAMFVFIGVQPQSKIVSGLVMCSGKGYIFTGPDLMADKKPPFDKLRTAPQGWTLERDPYLLETSTPGIFAAGDVRYGTNHRVASAVGEGAIAFALMKEYLKTL